MAHGKAEMNDVQEKYEVTTKDFSEFFDCELKEIFLLIDYLSVRSYKIIPYVRVER